MLLWWRWALHLLRAMILRGVDYVTGTCMRTRERKGPEREEVKKRREGGERVERGKVEE